MNAAAALELADWRRQVADLYAEVRRLGAGRDAWEVWRSRKESLYRTHPQSPVPAGHRESFRFSCFDHDPTISVVAELAAGDPVHFDGDEQVPGMTRVGALHFELDGAAQQLAAYWLDGYAGGLFVPFADATSGRQTYGGGRYVLDAAKGADLGTRDGRILLDFNFAYAPSCAHDPQWRCPLAGAGSRLSVAVRGGELS